METPCLESIVFIDIISSILTQIPESFVDHCLRAYFENLITLHQNLKGIVENSVPRYHKVHEVIILNN